MYQRRHPFHLLHQKKNLSQSFLQQKRERDQRNPTSYQYLRFHWSLQFQALWIYYGSTRGSNLEKRLKWQQTSSLVKTIDEKKNCSKIVRKLIWSRRYEDTKTICRVFC